MGKVIIGMTISLDGFVNDRHGSMKSLYSDFDEMLKRELMQESIKNTGAVVMGKNTYAMGNPDAYDDHYEYQVPIFVLTHEVPKTLPKQSERLTFTFVTDGIESAIAKAKAAAGDKDVTVIGGASTFQQCLKAGVGDEIQLDIMPVLLYKGLRLFEGLEDMEPLELEKVKVVESSMRTYLGFRVVKKGVSK
jgi:dihydrofolate reductase